MTSHKLRGALLATSSALALLVGIDGSAQAGTCVVVANPSTPYSQAGNTCVTFNNVVRTGSVTNTGTVTATGTIAPSVTGISVVNNATINGSVTNTGTINATEAGIAITDPIGVFGASVTGAILNAAGATINGTAADGGQGIIVSLATVGSITNNGTITENNYPGTALEINGATVNGNVVNNGPMSAFATGVIQFVGFGKISGNIINSGSLTNIYSNSAGVNLGAGIYIYSAQGPMTVTGAIENTSGGTITGGFGVQVFATSTTQRVTIGGGITNSGTITVGRTGVQIGSATLGAAINNSGTISAGLNGIQLINLTTATAPGGTPTNLGTAGPPSVAGGITNSGTISASGGSGYGGIVLVNANVTNGITNAAGATISAPNGVGILLSNTGKVTYSGAATSVPGIPGPGATYTVTGAGSTLTGGITNSGTIAAKTGIAVNGGSTVVGGITNSGTGTINGSVDAINLAGEGGPTAITINGGAVSGNIVGGGSDTVAFTLGGGTILTYTGAISAVSSVAVNSGTLYDNKSIGAPTVSVTAGTLAPGLPGTVGTLAITGNLAFTTAATYLITVTPAAASSATVSGTATLSGTVDAVFQPGGYLTKQYDILHFAGRTGTMFTTLTTNNQPANTTATLSYTATDVFLNLVGTFGSASGLNQNQQAVANAINAYFNNGGTLPPGFAAVFGLSGAQLSQALSELDGEDGTGAATSTFQLVNDFFDLLSDIALGGGGGGGPNGGGASGFAAEANDALPPDVALAYRRALGRSTQAAPQNFEQRWTAWGSGYGGGATYDGSAAIGSNNLTASDYGYAGGMDYHAAPDLKLGFALAGGGTNWSIAQNLGGGRSDAFQAAAYGIKHYGPLYFTAMAAFGNSWFTTSRTAALGDQLRASFDGQDYALRGEAGYRYAVMPMVGLTPYAAIQTQWLHTPGYSETDITGGGFGLTYAAQNANDTRSELGARADDLTMFDNMPLVLRARLAWAHDWVSGAALTPTFQALPGASFTVNGAAVPQNSALVSAGGQLFLTANWSVEGKFDGEFASSAQTYAGTGTIRYTW